MSQAYDQVVSTLRTEFGWTEFCAPAPKATEKQLAVDSPNTVAITLDSWVRSVVAAGLPYGCAPEDGYAWACYEWFQINKKFWEHDSAVALGQQHEVPVDTIGPAYSPTEWWDHQEKLRNRLGEKLCAQDEFDRRKSYANLVPIEWSAPGMDGAIYQLAVREGYMPVGMTGFDPAYMQTNPAIAEVRGLTSLQWLQNLQARDKGMPIPWLPGGDPNPAVQ